MGFLHATGNRCCLGGQLLSWSFTSGRCASGLLRTWHVYSMRYCNGMKTVVSACPLNTRTASLFNDRFLPTEKPMPLCIENLCHPVSPPIIATSLPQPNPSHISATHRLQNLPQPTHTIPASSYGRHLRFKTEQ